METRAKAGASLEGLVRMALPLLKQAERDCPRTGPGAKPEIPDWFLGTLIMVAVLMRKKSKSAQYRFLEAHRSLLATLTGEDRFPARSTYFDRYRRAHRLFRIAVRLQGEKAIDEGVAAPRHTAVDKSLIAGHGPAWHKRDRQAGRVPRGVDTDSTWGYSEHDGWVQGYSFEVVVCSTPQSIVFPLLASADVASAAEAKTFAEKIGDLPAEVKTVSADSGYDANALGEAVEYDRNRRTGRRFLCPENPRNSGRKKTRPGHADKARAQSRQRRAARKHYLNSPAGRRIYKRRSKTVEPFNSWFKALFELEHRAWHRGLTNNRTQLLAAIFVYQLLVRYNVRRGQRNGQLRAIFDTL